MYQAAGVSEEFTKKMEEWENRKKKSTGKGITHQKTTYLLIKWSNVSHSPQVGGELVMFYNSACFPLSVIRITEKEDFRKI